jgi:hypothetical protein
MHGWRPFGVELPRCAQCVLRDGQLSAWEARRGLWRLLVVASHRRVGKRLSLSRELRAHDRDASGLLKPARGVRLGVSRKK